MFAKNGHLNWVAGRVNTLSGYIISIFFNFWCRFCGSSPMLFPKALASCCKKFELIFAALYFYIYEIKKCVSDFKNLISKINVAQVLKENSIISGSWSSAKLFMVQNYTENANGDVPLTAENV